MNNTFDIPYFESHYREVMCAVEPLANPVAVRLLRELHKVVVESVYARDKARRAIESAKREALARARAERLHFVAEGLSRSLMMK